MTKQVGGYDMSLILVIDDQPGIRRLLKEVLTDSGYQVAIAANGYEGVQKAKELSPVLILMDMKMPGMDGIQTLKELRRVGIKGTVLMMTAYGELNLVEEAKANGAIDYLTKPFDIIQLSQQIEEYVHSTGVKRKIV